MAVIVSLPIVLMRETALERRLTGLPRGIAIPTVLLVLALAGAGVSVDLVTPPRFIGDHRPR